MPVRPLSPCPLFLVFLPQRFDVSATLVIIHDRPRWSNRSPSSAVGPLRGWLFRSAILCAWVGRGGGPLTRPRSWQQGAAAVPLPLCPPMRPSVLLLCTLLSSRQAALGALGAVCHAVPCWPRLDLRIAAAGLRFRPIPPSRLLRLPVCFHPSRNCRSRLACSRLLLAT